MSNERIRLSDKEVADVIKLCEFVITSLGGSHDENIRAKKVLNKFVKHCETSQTRGTNVSSILKEDVSRISLEDLMT